MSANSLSLKNIKYDLKTLQQTVKNLGQNLHLQSNNSSTPKQQQKTTNSSTSQKQQKSNNSSPLENPHQQTAKVINSHTKLSEKLKNCEDFSTDFKKEIDNHPNLSDDEKTNIKGDHQSNSRYLDIAREHLDSAKKKSNNYPISKIHLKHASNNLNKFKEGATASINKFGNTLYANSKVSIGNITKRLSKKLSGTENGQTNTTTSKNQTNTTTSKNQNKVTTPKQ